MKFAAVILAAGKGTRMSSDLPKVLHAINDKPLISHIIDTVKSVAAERICVVVGYRAELVERACEGEPVEFVLQEPQLGTGHAVLQCQPVLRDFDGTILVLNGDVPCLRSGTIRDFIRFHHDANASATVLTTVMKDPTGYGRIIRDNAASLLKIVEQKDASDEEQRIDEVNTGLFCFNGKALFSALADIDQDNAQNEYYLTDIIAIMKNTGLEVKAHLLEDPMEVAGINTDSELEMLREYMREK
jgi:UDP-N-acetylglucosamine diphosphorylase/glucosamine-1-phosphate N-acetyltransferase